ncbi:hypothetical protein F4824DRAFT_514801 [Ustulina deusta]|nr:hypothetical protein F4824DRAFT_514801 [Ustulina deusta]
MSHLAEVRALYAIADNIHSGSRPRTNIPHDADALRRLVVHESLAVRNPRSGEVTEFVDCYRLLQGLGENPLDNIRLIHDLIRGFMFHIDNIFFFNTLTRRVGGPTRPRSLVALHTSEDPNTKKYGTYDRADRTITVMLSRYRSGLYHRHHIERVLFSVVHEMTHAFLEIFSDDRHPRHAEWVDADNGHGKMFCELLGFIGDIVSQLTQSRKWQEERHFGHYGPSETRPKWPGQSRPEYPPAGLPVCCHGGTPGYPGLLPSDLPPSGLPPSGLPPSGFPPSGSPPGGFPPRGFFPPGGFPF